MPDLLATKVKFLALPAGHDMPFKISEAQKEEEIRKHVSTLEAHLFNDYYHEKGLAEAGILKKDIATLTRMGYDLAEELGISYIE